MSIQQLFLDYFLMLRSTLCPPGAKDSWLRNQSSLKELM